MTVLHIYSSAQNFKQKPTYNSQQYIWQKEQFMCDLLCQQRPDVLPWWHHIQWVFQCQHQWRRWRAAVQQNVQGQWQTTDTHAPTADSMHTATSHNHHQYTACTLQPVTIIINTHNHTAASHNHHQYTACTLQPVTIIINTHNHTAASHNHHQ